MRQDVTSSKMIRINGEKREFQINTEALFEDFIKGLNETLNQENQVISSMKINGEELSEKKESLLKTRTLNEVGDIEVMTAHPSDLAYETINTLTIYINQLILNIGRASQNYTKKNMVTADNYFVKALDGLDLFIQTIGAVKAALKVGLNPKVALAEASLVSIMNDLLDAKRANNYIFLAELLEKDLIENLQEWKEKALPVLSTWKMV